MPSKEQASSVKGRIARWRKTAGERLDLGNLSLTEIPEELFKLKDVTDLSLENNKLSTLTPRLQELAGLRWLTLQNNSIDTIPTWVFKLPQLRTLNVGRNKLKKLPTPRDSAVVDLRLWGNDISSLDGVSDFPMLRHLDVSDNPLKDSPPNGRILMCSIFQTLA